MSAEVSQAASAGVNLLEREQLPGASGWRRVQMASGKIQTQPVYRAKYVIGQPFGHHQTVIAPIDLLPGDVVQIDADMPAVGEARQGEPMPAADVVLVMRSGEKVWPVGVSDE